MWGLTVSYLVLLCSIVHSQNHTRQKGRLLFDKSLTCEVGSCYPGTGNLLIGREHRLFASSTCGSTKQERFCIVSHLENKKNCFWCDSRPHVTDRSMSHNISNIVDIREAHTSSSVDPWWQSENGVENVFIQLDMEAEFHFTHLIIRFKTFRPAAMLIERSQDFGKTWQVYRYFAFECHKSFPGVRTGIPRHLNDVICDSRYSNVNPSSDGELIFRVIQPNIPVDDPFSPQVQELIKMTNLRINFTKLHTLGDNLLDRREEIQEKYYYAIKHMIVRGSCSCYGHANRCLPKPEVAGANYFYSPDMVHGQCECTHNTTGPNCDRCESFYNDLPWKAAFGKSQNACKKCNCNNHAISCTFNEAVFISTGNVTGGVCDNCMHHTQGKNCEQCVPFYFHDRRYDMQSPYACQPCDCDTRGTIDDGVCDSFSDLALGMESGNCHCKQNIGGRQCDRCKEGFWNFSEANPLGCEPCKCNLFGTVDNLGCNVYSGECSCKRNVVGRDCNQCKLQFWGLSEDRDGCKPCDCDPGGSYDNDCDVISGQCRCRPHVIGRTCDQPEQSYFTGFPDFMVYEAELAKATQDAKIQIVEPNRDGREVMWTGSGYMRTYEGSVLEFTIDNVPTALQYNIVVRYAPQLPNGWDRVNVKLIHLDEVDADSVCANSSIGLERDTPLPSDARHVTIEPSVCLEPGHTYKVILSFDKYDPNQEVVSASVLVDSIVLFPSVEALAILHPDDQSDFDRYRCGETFLQPNHAQLSKICFKWLQSIGTFVNQGAYQCNCDPTGSYSFECSPLGGQCDCKPNVVGRRCDMCAPGTYGFSPEGCIACDCNSLALDNICDANSGQCKCRANTYGRVCDQCQIGFWNFPNCQRCECNGHAQTCDSRTGICINCQDYTEGIHCDRCLDGFYGAPQIGNDIPCRACPCPGSADSGHSHAPRCSLLHLTQDIKCECEIGYAGDRCDRCADNYYGNPEVPGGTCQPCDCNNNIDVTRPGNCDPKTGKCLQCLYNTEGDHCEICKERFFGDALNQQCTECVCDLLGSNQTMEYCDRKTGQCPCLPNVVGMQCDSCYENHWKIASGEGCEPCNCDRVGSSSTQCNPYDGQCYCKVGFGSRRCDECQTNYWGNPNEKCFKCDCELSGSRTMQCNRKDGKCVCVDGIGGDRCDKCARGYLPLQTAYAISPAAQCASCGECFNNWDHILDQLRNETRRLVSFAANIKEVGVWGAYTTEFGEMEKALQEVQELLSSSDVSVDHIVELKEIVEDLGNQAHEIEEIVRFTTSELENTERDVNRADLALDDLKNQVHELNYYASELKENATRLQEANVEGALNLTRKARKDSQDAENAAQRAVDEHLVNAERQCKRAVAMHNKTSATIGKDISENEHILFGLRKRLTDLEYTIPNLNEKVCGKESICDAACGGAGCGSCGGISCDVGAVTKANVSAELVQKADKTIKEKEAKAEEFLRSVTQAKADALSAKNVTLVAFEKADAARNSSVEAMDKYTEFTNKLDRFMATAGAKPSEIRTVADETRKLNINLKPDQVKELALKIQTAVSVLTNIDIILQDTNYNKELAKTIRDDANMARAEAEDVLSVVHRVGTALEEASNAQSKADAAIRQASSDIASAEKDLTQISSESSEAQSKANETLDSVRAQSKRVHSLNIKFTKNKLSAEDIQKEVDIITAESNRTLQQVGELKKKYEEAEGALDKRAGRSNAAKERAKILSLRASQFFVITSNKEKDLKDLEKSYLEKDKTLNDITAEIEALSKVMEDLVQHIGEKSKYYSECIA